MSWCLFLSVRFLPYFTTFPVYKEFTSACVTVMFCFKHAYSLDCGGCACSRRTRKNRFGEFWLIFEVNSLCAGHASSSKYFFLFVLFLRCVRDYMTICWNRARGFCLSVCAFVVVFSRYVAHPWALCMQWQSMWAQLSIFMLHDVYYFFNEIILPCNCWKITNVKSVDNIKKD